MAEYDDREHFIPLRKNDVIELLMRQPELPATERENFAQFCKLVVATYHFEYHKTLEELKDAYAPFDPDADTHPLDEPSREEMAAREGEVFEKLKYLMKLAKFEQKSQEDVEAALEGTSEGGINMDIDLKVFEEDKWMIFARGDSKDVKTVRRWYKLFKKETVEDEMWKRLVLVFKLQPHKLLSKNLDFTKIYTRVYKNIPKMDLETLIPGARPQMTLKDKANIGVPVTMGFGLLLWKVLSGLLVLGMGTVLAAIYLQEEALTAVEQTVLTTTVALAALGVFSYSFKSYTSYLNLKNRYEKNLSQALYYQTLDGNAGTLFRLLDEAEEQECREAILGYYFLWLLGGDEGWTMEHLDDHIEEFIEAKTGVLIDFEINDAIEKLEELRIVEKLPSGNYRAQPIEKALEMLDYTWDNYFKYNNPEPEEPPIPAAAS
jgi:hypothetical protein